MLARENSDHDLINKDESQIEKIYNHRKYFSGKGVIKKLKAPVAPKPEEKKESIKHVEPSPK